MAFDRMQKVIIGAVILLLVLVLVAVGLFVVWILLRDRDTLETPSVEQQLCFNQNCSNGGATPPVLLVSMDGFRAEYLERKLTPTLQALKDCGVHIPFIYPSFPSKTFPNHYALVTGLYPESHGIIDNAMFDPTIRPVADQTFSLKNSSQRNSGWWFGEPIWNTVVKNGQKSATNFWPGSEVEIDGVRPTHWQRYNKSMTFEARVDQIVKWLTMDDPSERPQLVTAYFHQPDANGHDFGPNSPEVNQALRNIDDIMKLLLEKLSAARLLNCINIVIVADHGMQQLKAKENRLITLDSFVDPSGLTVFNGTTARIMINNPAIAPAQLQQQLSCKDKRIKVFTRESRQLPRRLHYARSKRIGDVVVVVEPGYYFTKSSAEEFLKGWGNHGYDYRTRSMHAVFMAHGPAFRRNVTGQPFQNVEINYLLHDLLRMPIKTKNNGTEGALRYLLKDPPKLSEEATPIAPNVYRQTAIDSMRSISGSTIEKLMDKYQQWAPRQSASHFRAFNGSIFDYNNDGIADTIDVVLQDRLRSPTHFYLVVFWKQTENETSRVLSIVLPNEVNIPCQKFMQDDDYYFMHTARLRDVELLTGLEFVDKFPGPLTNDEALALRTHINDYLWWRHSS